MIITRTPFRISFFGGGTDIPNWFSRNGGQVLSTTINKYCYVTARPLPPFFDHSIRLAYSKVETVDRPAQIEHPLLRVVLEDQRVNNVEVHYDADLPGRSGLGTSSSFAVGLVAALAGLHGKLLSRKQLADAAIRYERNILQESGGYQDQVAAAYGGLNHIVFNPDGSYQVQPLPLPTGRKEELRSWLVLCDIPIRRISSEVSLSADYKKEYDKNLEFIHDSVDDAIKILQNGDLADFGRLLHETWVRKREFSGVTKPQIDEVYELGKKAGAIGGKLLGAGGGGFMLFVTPPDKRESVMAALNDHLVVPFGFDTEGGGQIIYYREPETAPSEPEDMIAVGAN